MTGLRDSDEPMKADDVALVARVLARLVRSEYPTESLVKIASTWDDDLTDVELAALKRVAPSLDPAGLGPTD